MTGIEISKATWDAVLKLGEHLTSCRVGCTTSGCRCAEGLRLREGAFSAWRERDEARTPADVGR